MGAVLPVGAESPSITFCPSCQDLTGLPDTIISTTLSEVNGTARRGCQSCEIIRKHHVYGKGKKLQPPDCEDSEVRFEMIIADAGYPMAVGTSIEEEDFFWEELFTITGSPAAPW